MDDPGMPHVRFIPDAYQTYTRRISDASRGKHETYTTYTRRISDASRDKHETYTTYTRRIHDASPTHPGRKSVNGPGRFMTEAIESTPAFLNFVTERFLKIRLSTMRRDVFQAIADPTRREIINLLAHQALNLNAIADNFHISRPAVSKHIRILTECGLLMITQQGRERYCKANLQKLQEVAEWTEQFKSFWIQKLDALEDFLEKEKKDNGKK